MQLVERTKDLMLATGSAWVLWLLVALSVTSIAIILERVIALRSLRGDVDALRQALLTSLREGGFVKAREAMARFRHPAARVVAHGMSTNECDATAKEIEDSMAAEAIAQRRSLERRFNFLATLGANAPFIGLFGTVIGILQAFDGLGRVSATASALAPQAVMSSIAEALVATAVGLGVAIPAVFAFNMFQRTVRSAFDDVQMMSLEVLAYINGRSAGSSGTQDAKDSARTPTPSKSALHLGRAMA